MRAYLLIPEERKSEILECGADMSLARDFVCKVTQGNGRAFLCRLNPADYAPEEISDGLCMVKAELNLVRAFVAEGTFLDASPEDPSGDCWRAFQDSFLPAAEYRLGMYRRPLCLIASPILPEALEDYDSVRDEAVCYPNSETLYTDRRFEEALEQAPELKEKLLADYCRGLAEQGRAVCRSAGALKLYETEDKKWSYLTGKE